MIDRQQFDEMRIKFNRLENETIELKSKMSAIENLLTNFLARVEHDLDDTTFSMENNAPSNNNSLDDSEITAADEMANPTDVSMRLDESMQLDESGIDECLFSPSVEIAEQMDADLDISMYSTDHIDGNEDEASVIIGTAQSSDSEDDSKSTSTDTNGEIHVENGNTDDQVPLLATDLDDDREKHEPHVNVAIPVKKIKRSSKNSFLDESDIDFDTLLARIMAGQPVNSSKISIETHNLTGCTVDECIGVARSYGLASDSKSTSADTNGEKIPKDDLDNEHNVDDQVPLAEKSRGNIDVEDIVDENRDKHSQNVLNNEINVDDQVPVAENKRGNIDEEDIVHENPEKHLQNVLNDEINVDDQVTVAETSCGNIDEEDIVGTAEEFERIEKQLSSDVDSNEGNEETIKSGEIVAISAGKSPYGSNSPKILTDDPEMQFLLSIS